MRGNERGCCCYCFFFCFFSTIHTHTTSVFSCSTYFQCYVPTYLPNPRIMVNYNKMKAGGGGVRRLKKKHGPWFFFLKKKNTSKGQNQQHIYIHSCGCRGGMGVGYITVRDSIPLYVSYPIVKHPHIMNFVLYSIFLYVGGREEKRKKRGGF